MFSGSTYKRFFHPDYTAGNKPVKKSSAGNTKKELGAYIEELQKLNLELVEARRAAFNLLEDAVQSREALLENEKNYRCKLEEEVLKRTTELKESRQQYISLVENTPDVITRWNKQLRLLYANTAFADKTGTDLKELYGKTSSEMGQPEELTKAYTDSILKVFQTGQPLEHYSVIPKGNEEVYYYSRIVPERNEKGEIETVLAIARDITELKKKETEIFHLKDEIAQRATDKYYSIFNSIDEGFCIVEILRNEEGRAIDYCFLEVNQSFEKQTGLKNVVGKKGEELNLGTMKDLVEIYDKVSRTGESIRFEKYYEETDRWFDSYVSRIGHHGGGNVALVFSDVTARKKAEIELESQIKIRVAELRQQHALLQQAEELAQAGSWEYNLATKEFTWSDGMYQLFQLEKGKLVYPSIYVEHAIEEDKAMAQKLVNVIEKDPSPTEVTLRLKIKEKLKTIRIKVNVMKNKDGKTEKTIGADLDVTETVHSQERIDQLNESLRRTNKKLSSVNSELQTFNSIAANDYHEMLKNLYISLELIVTQDARNLSNTGRANIRRAQGTIQKMKLLTEDMVAYSKLYEIHSQSIFLDELIEEIKRDFERKGIEIRAGDDCRHQLNIDVALFTLMAGHLLDNINRHKKENVHPQVLISCRDSENNDEQGVAAKKYKIVSFSDNGKGMDEQEIQNLFEVSQGFYAKNKAGMGLAICKKIMEMHNGYLTIDSEEGVGTTVYCFFPA